MGGSEIESSSMSKKEMKRKNTAYCSCDFKTLPRKEKKNSSCQRLTTLSTPPQSSSWHVFNNKNNCLFFFCDRGNAWKYLGCLAVMMRFVIKLWAHRLWWVFAGEAWRIERILDMLCSFMSLCFLMPTFFSLHTNYNWPQWEPKIKIIFKKKVDLFHLN